MNLLRESLFSSSKSSTTGKSKKVRQNQLRAQFRQSSNPLTEPLIGSSDNETSNSIELGTINSDDEGDAEQHQANSRLAVRSRHVKPYATPTAHGGGSIVIVEKPVRPQETIQAFAIRYRVPVSQLKRLNNLQNDQDFYALAYCRVPVRRFGLLHELSSPSTIVNFHEQSTLGSMPTTHLSQQNHHAFLNAMDHDLALMRAKVEQLIETPSVTLLAPDPHSSPLTTASSSSSTAHMFLRSSTKPISELNCDGADCGCKFWHIILAIVLIALLIPLIYIYVYVEYPPATGEHAPK